MVRGNSPLDFEIEHDGEVFATEQQKAEFGFRPLDVFLVDEVPGDDVLEPRVVFYGESSDELIENIEDDILLASRYVREDFDIDNSVSVPWGIRDYPAVQREFSKASVNMDEDFKGFLQLLDDGFEDVDTEFVYRLESRENGNVERSTDIEEYVENVSDRPLTAWPEIYGVNSVTLFPQSFKAVFTLYRQEVTAPRNEEAMRKHGIGGDEYWETVELNYDEDPIEALENSLEQQGFATERDYLPPSVAPSELQ